ncbi:MAG: zf-HC2 domain-containing protein [Actinomycetota bacterium]|nr:zf-HC2 domain-containing protein [Actinomycetota bacterium]
MAVTCEEVRELLPEYADWGPRPAGDVEHHLASCQGCSAVLASLRSLLSSLEGLRSVEVEPDPGFLERTLEVVHAGTGPGRVVSIAELRAARNRLAGMVRMPRTGYAVASLTGAAVGATAIALLWWRIARRAMTHGAM